MSEPTPTAPEATGDQQGRRRSDGRFAPGASGNPAGRPKGCRNRAVLLAETLIDEAAGRVTEVAVDLALKGDLTAIKLILDRLIPPRKDRPVMIDLPELKTAADAALALAGIADAVARGELFPGEAADLARPIEAFMRAHEITEIEERLRRLEAGQQEQSQ